MSKTYAENERNCFLKKYFSIFFFFLNLLYKIFMNKNIFIDYYNFIIKVFITKLLTTT